jgi:hypothetical protein
MNREVMRTERKGIKTDRLRVDNEEVHGPLADRRGVRLLEFSFLGSSMLLFSTTLPAQDLPGGTAVEARLSSATGSRVSHRGDPIEATIIAPVSVQGRILIPQGSRLLGSIADAAAIGFGLKHSSSSVAYNFDTLELPSS